MEIIMTTMDVKAISWVGDIYQKFEAMCVEVEENVYQDSVNYVGSQVKTVGTCVKRFYSDVVQDLLPVSSDDQLKPENTCLKLVNHVKGGICNKSDVDVKGEQKKCENIDLSRNSHFSSPLDENADNRLSSGSNNSNSLCQTPLKEPAECLRLHVQQSGNEEICFCNSNTCEEKFRPSEISDPEIVQPQLALVSNDDESASGLGDETAECLATSVNLSTSISSVWEEFGKDEESVRISDVSNEPFWDEFEIDDAYKEAFQSSEQLSKLKLEESCVLVDKYDHFSASPLEGKQRSYKKKIKDVFHLRRWSSSKNLKEDPDSSNTVREMSASTYTSEFGNTYNLQSSSIDEWEIL